MTFPKRSPLNGSVFAVALTAIALLVTLLLRPFVDLGASLPFMAAVWLSAWYHGRAAGVLSTIISAAAILYFFSRPAFGGPVQWSELTMNLGFVVIALALTWMTAGWRESRRVLSSMLSSIGEAVTVTDSQGRVTFMNAVAETLTGWNEEDARGKHIGQILPLKDSQTKELVENPLVCALREHSLSTGDKPLTLTSRSGVESSIEHTASPVRDSSGEIRGGVLVFRDISKRLQLEEQVTHAEKMDAVGRLAGGVAGDFNNVLTVITGYAELLRAEAPDASPVRRFSDEIIYATERATALTRHLLAFSRGATAQPKVIDLNQVIAPMEPMLRRLLGQNIELIVLASPGLGRVKADPAQLEQSIVNLAANARDAMPDGGKLILEISNADLDDASAKKVGVRPGSYVMVAVSDTGIGMDQATRSRLFEPFFTTKEPGKGSGLGLATVYGAVRQMDGQVSVYSQPGCGTIFEIYLPRVTEAVSPAVRKHSPKGSETILLVDDEDGVRKLVHAVLQSNGYEVIEANNGAAALAAYEKNGHKIDMVLTDVVMPQLNGFELGRQLKEQSPALKILYMSGYRDNAPGASGGQGSKAFLHKPFTPDVLLSTVREILDAETTGAA
jgi:two-component system, cell cycle sensor histidine kinase and response regulator CckA